MLTAKQHELLRFIHQRLSESGVSPSFDEMREALDLKSKSGVHRLISALEERQFIRRLPNRARALEVVKMPDIAAPAAAAAASPPAPRPVVPSAANDTIDLPLHGRRADHAAHHRVRAGLHLEEVATVQVGAGTGGGAFDHHIGEGLGFGLAVLQHDHQAGDGALLGEREQTGEQCDGKKYGTEHGSAFGAAKVPPRLYRTLAPGLWIR